MNYGDIVFASLGLLFIVSYLISLRMLLKKRT
jgi:hypothetical protein